MKKIHEVNRNNMPQTIEQLAYDDDDAWEAAAILVDAERFSPSQDEYPENIDWALAVERYFDDCRRVDGVPHMNEIIECIMDNLGI